MFIVACVGRLVVLSRLNCKILIVIWLYRFNDWCDFNHLLRGHISVRVLTGTWAEGEASDVQALFAGISYVVFGSWDLGKPLSSPT